MSNIEAINGADGAPAAIGTYSQAVRAGELVFLSGQIGLEPASGELAAGFAAQARQVFANLAAVAAACGGSLDDAVKLNVYLRDLGDFAAFNQIAATELSEPYPARALIQAAALPKDAQVEVEAILHLPG